MFANDIEEPISQKVVVLIGFVFEKVKICFFETAYETEFVKSLVTSIKNNLINRVHLDEHALKKVEIILW